MINEKWDKPVPNVCQTVFGSERIEVEECFVFNGYKDFDIGIYEHQQKTLELLLL